MVLSISEFPIPTTETRSPTVHYEEWSTVMQIQETENGTRFNLKTNTPETSANRSVTNMPRQSQRRLYTVTSRQIS